MQAGPGPGRLANNSAPLGAGDTGHCSHAQRAAHLCGLWGCHRTCHLSPRGLARWGGQGEHLPPLTGDLRTPPTLCRAQGPPPRTSTASAGGDTADRWSLAGRWLWGSWSGERMRGDWGCGTREGWGAVSEQRGAQWQVEGPLAGSRVCGSWGGGPLGKARGRVWHRHAVWLPRQLPPPLRPELNHRPPPSGAQGCGTEKGPAPRGREHAGAR